MPKDPHQPATRLGRLAVDRRHQKQGIGEILLLDALRRSYLASELIGSIAVVVDVLNQTVSEFYQQYGFIPLSDQPKLFMPMKIIRPSSSCTPEAITPSSSPRPPPSFPQVVGGNPEHRHPKAKAHPSPTSQTTAVFTNIITTQVGSL